MPRNDIQKQGRILMLPVDCIEPSPYQARTAFDEPEIAALAVSILQNGLLQPISVRRVGLRKYQLIAGERRLRACRLAGIKKIPAIEMEFDDQQMMEIALLENIQREDLNAIEEAKAYEKLIQKVGYTQEELARRIGKSREHVANMMRLLKLPVRLQQHVTAHELSMGHVRALLSLEDEALMEEVAQKAIREQMSVRAVEKLVKGMVQPKPKKKEKARDIHMEAVEHRLQERFQTTVKVANGQIVIRYDGDDDLNRILEMIGGLDEGV